MNIVEIFGIPFDLAGRYSGTYLAPDAIRDAGLLKDLKNYGVQFVDHGNTDFNLADKATAKKLIHVDDYEHIKQLIRPVLLKNHFPLILGGDHSIAIGTIAAALEIYHEKLAVLWVDAHPDINTHLTSLSGNVHGMPVGALMGLDSSQKSGQASRWDDLINLLVPTVKLTEKQIAWLGIRDIDPSEQKFIDTFKSAFVAYMYQIRTRRIDAVLGDFDTWMRQHHYKYLWVSFDIDVMDPALAPGTGTPSPEGFNLDQMNKCIHMLAEAYANVRDYSLVGTEIVEVNPLLDSGGNTVRLAEKWASNIFQPNL